jgi:hypothetical protein
MAYENVLYLVLLEKLVVEEQDGAAGVAEHVLHTLFLQTAHNDLSTGNAHEPALGQ